MLNATAVRRQSNGVPGTVLFKDDLCWVEYGEVEKNCILEAFSAGHKETAVHINGMSYDIAFESNEWAVQTNRASGTKRDVRLISSFLSAEMPPKLTIEDCDALPDEFRCPISMMPFEVPVVAPDGHTYDLDWIRKHMAFSSTSPITKQALSSRQLYPNMNLRMQMISYQEKQKESRDPAPSDVKHSDRKRVRKSIAAPSSSKTSTLSRGKGLKKAKK